MNYSRRCCADPSLMKILHSTVVVIALVGAAALAWWLKNGTPAQAAVMTAGGAAAGALANAQGPVPVEVGRVQVMRLEDDTQAVGTLRSHQGVMLRPEVSGRVAKLGF